jgi:hypothetical protein
MDSVPPSTPMTTVRRNDGFSLTAPDTSTITNAIKKCIHGTKTIQRKKSMDFLHDQKSERRCCILSFTVFLRLMLLQRLQAIVTRG